VQPRTQGVYYWQGKETCCAFSVLAFSPNPPAMRLDDPFADHQSQAGSLCLEFLPLETCRYFSNI